MNKTKYEMAEMEIVLVDNTDVICTSTEGTNPEGGPTGNTEDGTDGF